MVLFWNRFFLLTTIGIFIFSCGSRNLSFSEMKVFKYIEIGDELFQKKDILSAKKYYDKALNVQPKLNEDNYFLSRMIKVYGEQGNELEIQKIKKRLKKDGSEIYYYCFGKIEFYLKNYDASRNYFKRAKNKAPRKKLSFYNCLIDGDC